MFPSPAEKVLKWLGRVSSIRISLTTISAPLHSYHTQENVMFKARRYQRRDEVVTRLRGSLIFLNRTPVLVREVADNKDLVVEKIRDGRSERVSLDDERINLELPTLGYVNTSRGAVYVMRRPLRLYKQGLVPDNIMARGHPSTRELMEDTAFADMLQGNYPSLEQAFSSSSTNPFKSRPVAFTKKLALKGSSLFYKGYLVGTINRDKTFSLSDRFVHLREEIMEILDA